MSNVRGFTDDIKGLNAEPIIGSPVDELLCDTISRIAMNTNIPVRIYPSDVVDEYLFLGPNTLEAGDGSGKITPPIDDSIGTFAGATLAFQSRTATATVMIDGASFYFPTSTIGRFRRLALSLNGDGTISCRWSDEATAVSLLTNPGALFATLGGLPCGYIDLECTFSDVGGGKFKTAGSATNVIENKAGSDIRIFRFGAGGGTGSAGDKSFKIGSVTASGVIGIKGGSLALASGQIIATYDGSGTTESDFQKDLTFSLSSLVTPVTSTTYYLYVDLYSLPLAITTTDGGRPIIPVISSNFVLSTLNFSQADRFRYAPVGVVRYGVGAWTPSVAITYPTKRIPNLAAGVSNTIFEVEQTIGAVGVAAQINAGHVLTQYSFPSAAYAASKVAFYNLAGITDGYGAHAFSNPNSAPFTGTGIVGDSNSCVAMTAASSHYLSSIADHFDPGDTDFTVGGWFNASSWTPVANKPLFSSGNAAGTDYIHLDLVATTGDLLLNAYTTGAEAKTFTYALGSGWVHIVLKYVAATNTFTLYVDGISKGDLVLSTGLGAIGGTRRFALGANAALTQFWDGRVDEFFFCNGYAFTSDDILKVHAAKIVHSTYLIQTKQAWSGSVTVGDITQDLQDFVVDMDSTALYLDLSGQLTSAYVYLSLQNKAFGGTVATSSSRMFEGTAGYLDGLGTFGHGLNGLPTVMVLMVEEGGGYWSTQDASSYFKVSTSMIAPLGGSNLTTVLGAGTNVKLLVSVGPSAVYVPPTARSWTTLVKSAAYAVSSWDEVLTNSSAGSFTLSLPGSPALGARVRVADGKGTWATYPVTINRSGNKINASATDLVCNVISGWVELVFDGVDNWVVFTA